MSKKTLANLAPGDHATVVAVGGERAVVRRLLEMGLLPGTPVMLARRAPLGDPLEVRLRGYSLSIRAVEARAIDVETR